MFKKVLIANRGAISCRIQRTLSEMGVDAVALYSRADQASLHRLKADEAVLLEGESAAETYLDVEQILAAARATGADAIHPGYGFLSENSEFARAVEDAGFVFLGPTPEQLLTCGLKHECRDLAKESGVPLLEGSAPLNTLDDALAEAERVGFPVIIKASGGGGGIGMQVVEEVGDFAASFERVRRLSESNFGNSPVFLERYITKARHIEVQAFGDGEGGVIAFTERDCSVQRRNQKIIEETPAPGLTEAERRELAEAAKALLSSVNYRSAGTVEFLWDDNARAFYFLEVNARLQVEHGVTEEIHGVDLVEWMVRLGAGEKIAEPEGGRNGAAIQARLYAEDPWREFLPCTGTVTEFEAPEGVRCDTWVEAGAEVTALYDPMIAKVIAHSPTREEAISKLRDGLSALKCSGLETNCEFVLSVLEDKAFVAGELSTGFLNDYDYASTGIDVVDAGLETTIQDSPGRLGYWDVGVPPSGPFDRASFDLGNQILGNASDAAGLEMTLKGATLKFRSAGVVCLTGADMGATLNGNPVAQFEAIEVGEGDTLSCVAIQGLGQRGYLLVKGGLEAPVTLGSRATFRLGKFGGLGGRPLRVGDVLRSAGGDVTEAISEVTIPELTIEWELEVTYGPHGAPEFFTPEDIETIFEASWEVHYNSDRTGVRLIGPKPTWARPDGGEAGLHPSNIHDNAYCVGSIDFTGDMPILLGPDGPSLGGFVCPGVIAKKDLWKMGQMRPGDRVKFRCDTMQSPIIEDNDGIRIRRSGEAAALVEFGAMELDLNLRFQVQALYETIQKSNPEAVAEMVPGIRSLQIQFDPERWSHEDLVEFVRESRDLLHDVSEMEFKSRIVHLPLSWDDPSTQEAINRYTSTVRPDAPWCPSNIEFIRRINGLESIADVYDTVYDASYMVLGLGDVYLGAPVATPLDPRHRLVTTKYNPARTWTPENAVGIGGAYLCIYGMEGPGGYQFVGRTLPIWNRYHTTAYFSQECPWLLRFFDQIRWFPVSSEELESMREDFTLGRYEVKIEETTFKVSDYHKFRTDNEDEIGAFRKQQRDAFGAERQRWEEQGLMNFESSVDIPSSLATDDEIEEGCSGVVSPVSGSLWKLSCEEGREVKKGDTLFILESMKMEMRIDATEDGTVERILVQEGSPVSSGQNIVSLRSL